MSFTKRLLISICFLTMFFFLAHAEENEGSDFVRNDDGSYSLFSESLLLTNGEEMIASAADVERISCLNVSGLDQGTIYALRLQLPHLAQYQVDTCDEQYIAVDGILFSRNMKTLIAYPIAKSGQSYQVPDGVEIVEEGAFEHNQELEYISFPDSVRIISNDAFQSVSALSAIQFNEGLESIGDRAFESCSQLKQLTMPASLKIIGFAAFRYSGLTTVSLQEGTLCIMGEAFAHCDCKKPFTIFIPSSVVYIDSYIFCPEMHVVLQAEEDSYANRRYIAYVDEFYQK